MEREKAGEKHPGRGLSICIRRRENLKTHAKKEQPSKVVIQQPHDRQFLQAIKNRAMRGSWKRLDVSAWR